MSSTRRPGTLHVHSKYQWSGYIDDSQSFLWVDEVETRALCCLVIDSEIDSFGGCDASDYAVAVAFEPHEIQPNTRSSILRNSSKFKLILTYDRVLLSMLPRKAVPFPVGGCYLQALEDGRHIEKTEGISLSVSNKQRTVGHRFRHRVSSKFIGDNRVALMGGAWAPYEDWGEPYRRFRFNIAIENSRHNFYFTEKLVHPLLMDTVPIYFGSPKLPPEFVEEGLLRIKSWRDLRRVVNRADENLFNDLSDARERNRIAAEKYKEPRQNIMRIVTQSI